MGARAWWVRMKAPKPSAVARDRNAFIDDDLPPNQTVHYAWLPFVHEAGSTTRKLRTTTPLKMASRYSTDLARNSGSGSG